MKLKPPTTRTRMAESVTQPLCVRSSVYIDPPSTFERGPGVPAAVVIADLLVRVGSGFLDRLDTAALDRLDEPRVVPLVLVGTRGREPSDGLVEPVVAADVPGDRRRIPRVGVGTGQS